MATDAPAVHGVLETALYVDDLARSGAFFRDVLGLTPLVGDDTRFQAFDSGAQRVLLLFKRGATLAPAPVPGGVIPPHDGHGAQHIALAIEAGDYEAWRERLVRQGVSIEEESRWPRGGRSLYFRDPDGHLLELVTPGIWPIY